MRVFLICSVRGASTDLIAAQDQYVARLEADGHTVHYPPRDTDQSARGIDICKQNAQAIRDADEVHIIYRSDSQGTHFDMGAAFALGKRIVIAVCPEPGPGKSFPRMLREWEESCG